MKREFFLLPRRDYNTVRIIRVFETVGVAIWQGNTVRVVLGTRLCSGVNINIRIIKFYGVPQVCVLIVAVLLIGAADEQRKADQHPRQYGYTFAHDNGENPVMAKAHAYVEHWPEAFKKNIGLLLFGDVGTGKSFLARCIANALLDQDVPVLMTNFPTILSRLCGTFGEDRTDFLDSLGDYDLLIIDDLGAERNTEYALEQMFSIIDSRYRSNKPLIVTTNLKLDELKHPPDLAHARIYDRILECCAPILFAGKNFREDNAASTKAAARCIVSADHSKI